MLVVQRSCGRSGGCTNTGVIRPSLYQVVIPNVARERAGIRPGQHIRVLSVGSRVELVPVEPIQRLWGALEDAPRRLEREPKGVP
jgi:bifunctional DNA-binding transcriptional regulator/antitoxin component of YhaV-PrlF toxin-antitoxin module